jgi:PAS domain S-box-containing protein
MEHEIEVLRRRLEEYEIKYERLKQSLSGQGATAKDSPKIPSDNETLFCDTLDGSPIPIFVIDKNHKILKWNKALEQFSGIKAAEIAGTNHHWKIFNEEEQPLLADLLLDGDQEKIPAKYAKSNLVEGAYEGMRSVNKLGVEIWIHFTAAVIKDSNGNTVGAMETLKDITESRQAEEQANESREYLDQIINRISDLIFVKDSEHKYVHHMEDRANS